MAASVRVTMGRVFVFLLFAFHAAPAIAHNNAACAQECKAAGCTQCLANHGVCYNLSKSDCYAHRQQDYCWCGSPCTGSSADLDPDDCFMWQHIVLPSRYFEEAYPPACQDAQDFGDPCGCTGVVGCSDGRITSIHLSERNLTFSASTDDSLGHLSALRDLHLDNNLLSGPLPSWLQKLSGTLQLLELWSNKFTGGLDVLTPLTALKYLGLPDNGLSGSLNPLAQLTNLTFLSLCCNSGPFRDLSGISSLTKLETLNVWGGQVAGTLDAVKDLVQLQSLDLGQNQLNGTIDAVSSLTSLTTLGLGSNRLSGPIDAISSLTSLSTLRLENNQHAGSIPSELAQLSRLTDIGLSRNAFTGPLPSLNFSQFAACCDLADLTFRCPLPQGADQCAGGVCALVDADLGVGSCVRNSTTGRLSCSPPMCE